jgi:methyltransferase (TIGR00027 family)
MSHITHVSDTARWVAIYRAMETKRPDAIFRDPYAERLGGPQGQAIVDHMKNGRQMAWAMIVRTAVFDQVIRERATSAGVDLVLNLAAGLDARPWRMTELPPTLRWIDVDLPDMLDYKLDMLKDEKTVCRYDAIRLDLKDKPKRQALFSQLGGEAKRVLVVTEGLLVYLDDADVGDLARDLHDVPTFQWWLIDLVSPRIKKYVEKSWGKQLSAGNAPFRFAPENSTKFFEPFGWRELEFHSSIASAQRLNREMRGMWFWRFIGRLSSKKKQEEFRRTSGFPLLERT